MSKLITVNVFREDTMSSVSGIKVVLGGGYGESRTNRNGNVSFMVPNSVSSIDIYVSGSTAFSGYLSRLSSNGLNVLVSSSGYYKKTL